MKLYNTTISGNCYKIRLLLSFLRLDYEKINIDLKAKDQKKVEFLALNPLGQVPVLEDNGIYLRDSQAILCYIAREYDVEQLWFPLEPMLMAHVLEWLFFANQNIASSLAAARAFYLVNKPHVQIEHATEQAYVVLEMMNQHLSEQDWLVGRRATLADIACYPYVEMAHQGQIELDQYPYVQAWLRRFEQLPNFIELNS